MTAKPARSLEKYLPLFEHEQKNTVLDYGSGNLRNSLYLYDRGYTVFAVDLPHRAKLNSIPRLICLMPEELRFLNIKIDIALCTFVLNLISASERSELMRVIAGKIKPGGYLLIETKGLSQFELDMLTIPRGFMRIDARDGRYTLIALYQCFTN